MTRHVSTAYYLYSKPVDANFYSPAFRFFMFALSVTHHKLRSRTGLRLLSHSHLYFQGLTEIFYHYIVLQFVMSIDPFAICLIIQVLLISCLLLFR